MFSNHELWEDDEREFSPEEENDCDSNHEEGQTCEWAKVFIQRDMKRSIIGKNGRNIKRVQRIAQTHVDYFSSSLSVISIRPKINQSLEDAVIILKGIILSKVFLNL